MDVHNVIIGPVVTEKAEMQKAMHKTYTIRVAPGATKVDVKNALKKFWGVDAINVRVLRTPKKTRSFGRNKTMCKRKATKRMMVTLSEKSKALDLSAFSAS